MRNFRNINYHEDQLINGIYSVHFYNHDKAVLGHLFGALGMAKRAHKGQKRKEGGDYVIHPMRVANTLIHDLDVRDEHIVAAGLLHDVIEDSIITAEEIGRETSPKVAEYVLALTRVEGVSRREKFKDTLKSDLEVKLIKCCDWLDNLRSMRFLGSKSNISDKLKEVEEMYIPLAELTKREYLVREMREAYEFILRN